jgi:hypothetical protein
MQFKDEVTILRTDAPGPYGDPRGDWSNPTEIPAKGFWIAGSARRKDKTILMPPTTDIQAGDRVRLNGDVYQVVGEPGQVRSPSRLIMWRVSIRRLGGNARA